MELCFLNFCNKGTLCWFWWAETCSQVLNGIAVFCLAVQFLRVVQYSLHRNWAHGQLAY